MAPVESDGANARADLAATQGDTMLAAPKRCNGPGLSGSPCMASLGMPPDPATVPDAADGQAFAGREAARPKGRNPSGFLDPPRLG